MTKATFGAGCFWHVQDVLAEVKGVRKTTAGYEGGDVINPTYKDVCSGRTGHIEVVELEFDPSVISYDELLEVFWSIHDPTTPDRQGPDIGHQYRSAIFCHDTSQEAAARAMMEKLQESGQFRDLIITQIRPAMPFYQAEEYHQCYLKKKQG